MAFYLSVSMIPQNNCTRFNVNHFYRRTNALSGNYCTDLIALA